MKQLQNNFTTPEQSKRLLELGLPADSADCYISLEGKYHRGILSSGEFIVQPAKFEWWDNATILPCWSVGRLIEIILTCCQEQICIKRKEFGTEDLVAILEIAHNVKNTLDFSKLED